MTAQFRHKSAYGYTGTGKSTLLKERVAYYRKYKQQVIIYAGTGDIDFPQGCQFVWSADELEAALVNPENYGAFILLDEGAALYEEVQRKIHPNVHGLFMRGRHKGYTVWIATQYPTSIPRRIRLNCAERYLFATLDENAAQEIWKDCGRIDFEGIPLWQAIMKLNRFEYFRYVHPGEITRHITRKT